MPARDQGFPKKARLRKRSQFLTMSRAGRKIHTRHFLVLWRPNQSATSRLGITVTRRVANAVGRNRVKRRVREAFRLAKGSLPPGTDLVVIAKREAQLLDYPAVARQLAQAIQSISQRQTPAS